MRADNGNPFFHIRGSIDPVTGESFIGRARLLEDLLRNVRCGRPRHIAIHGLPHVGKTSILWELERQLKECGQPPRPGDKTIVTLKYTLLTVGFKQDISKILKELCRALRGKADGKLLAYLETAKTVTKPAFSLEVNNAYYLLDLLHTLLRQTTAAGFRVVLFLDEFERILATRHDGSIGWTEEEYTGFVRILLDDSLDFVCVTASRPRVSNLLVDYEQRLNPFVEKLVRCFDEEDMTAYFETLERCGRPVPPGAERQELLRYCGRSPLLLTHFGDWLLRSTDADPEGPPLCMAQIYEAVKDGFDSHFSDLVRFMREEEDKKERSFAHIVKCYFNPSADYWDIQERCIGLGYIDLLEPEGEFTCHDERFRFIDHIGKYGRAGHQYSYITVSPIFVNYLCTECLDEVQDARDLLTGFVYTLRDITAKELREELTPGASDPNQWNEVLLTRYVVAVVTRKEEDKGVKKTYFEFVRQRRRMTCQLLGSVRPEEKSIEFTTPTKFLRKEFNGSECGLVLEPINLNDHGRILLRFPDRFSPYFGCLGDLNLEETDAGKKLDSDLAYLADVRNKIAHYSRRGLTREMEQTTIRLCRKYLKSIYTYISTGKRAEADSVSGPSPEEWRSKEHSPSAAPALAMSKS